MRILGRIFGRRAKSRGIEAFDRAMNTSDDLIARMQEASRSTDAFRAVMADIWAQHHNIPFMTTVYEAVREMKAATTDQRDDHGTLA